MDRVDADVVAAVLDGGGLGDQPHRALRGVVADVDAALPDDPETDERLIDRAAAATRFMAAVAVLHAEERPVELIPISLSQAAVS